MGTAGDTRNAAGEQVGWATDDLPRHWKRTVKAASLLPAWGVETSEHPQEAAEARQELPS